MVASGKEFSNNIEDESRDLSKLDNRRGKELLKKFEKPRRKVLEGLAQENTVRLR